MARLTSIALPSFRLLAFRTLFTCIAVPGLLALPAASALADEAHKQELALEVMKLTGANELNANIAASVLTQIRPAYPTVPEEVWAELAKDFSAEEIAGLSVSLYARNFTESELGELIAFYKSPIGRKVIEKTPVIMEESMMIYGKWSEKKASEMIEKLRQRGYEPQGYDVPGDDLATPAP